METATAEPQWTTAAWESLGPSEGWLAVQDLNVSFHLSLAKTQSTRPGGPSIRTEAP